MHKLLLIALTLFSAEQVVSQTATYTYIKQPFRQNATLLLTALDLPKLGSTMRLRVAATNYRMGVSYFLAFGRTNPRGLIPGVNGVLFSSAEIVIPTPRSTGQRMSILSFPIPNSPQLLGVRSYQQVIEIDRGPRPHPPQLSRGGLAVLGRAP